MLPLCVRISSAANSALEIWRDCGSPAPQLARIENAARNDTVLEAALRSWFTPQPSIADTKDKKLEALSQHARRQRDKNEQSWVLFAAELRTDPGRLRKLRPVNTEGVDPRLFSVWQLLTWAARQDRYAIESVEPLVPIIGRDAALGARDALIGVWRRWTPRLKSTREPTERNKMSSIDCMGIAGITLESTKRPDWAEGLSHEEAARAAAYATLELAGFPSWIVPLVRAKRQEVTTVLMGEVVAEFDAPDPGPRCGILETILRLKDLLAPVVASPLLAELERRPNLAFPALRPALGILARASLD
jgi:hypothetical protein